MNASTTARGSTRGSTRARTATAITLSTLVVGAALTPASTAEAAQSAASSSAATAATAAAQVSTRPIADPTPPPSTRILQRVRLAATPVQIVNTYSNLAADVIGGNTAAGTGTWLWPRTGSQAQLVDLLPTDSGYFRIRVRHSGQCLMLDWRTGVGRHDQRNFVGCRLGCCFQAIARHVEARWRPLINIAWFFLRLISHASTLTLSLV